MVPRQIFSMIKMNRRINDEERLRFAHVMHTGQLPPGDEEEEDETDAEEDQWSLHF